MASTSNTGVVAPRVAVVDIKASRSWPEPAVGAVVPLFRPFGDTLGVRTRHPWVSLAKLVVMVEERYLGTTYIAAGKRIGSGEPRPWAGRR